MGMHHERLQRELQILVKDFTKATGKSMSWLSKEAVKDPNFVIRVDKGMGFTVNTYDRLIFWLSENWPDATPWPDGVSRPHVTRA